MKFRRDDFIPEGGLLTVRYLAIELGAEHTVEIRADADTVDIHIEYQADDFSAFNDIEKLVTRACVHHEFLKRYAEPMDVEDPSCVVEYDNRA